MTVDKDKVIFPCNAKKVPAVPEGTDWRDYKGEANSDIVGVMIPKGAFVIDVDTYKGVSVGDIEAVLGCALDWEAAELQQTQRGGKHYAFRVPDGVELVNGTDVLGISGFDTRSARKGYIATGKGYTDLTLFGVIETLHDTDNLVELPKQAVEVLRANRAEPDDLMTLVAAQLLELTDDEIKVYVEKLTAHDADVNWLKVGMAISHQTGGSEFGWALFDDFSKKCLAKYDKKQNRKRWESFRKNPPANPVTFASVIELVGGKQVVAVSKLEKLLEEAASIETREQYTEFKKKVSSASLVDIPEDYRSMLAGEIALGFGKGEGKGITKTEIKKALLPAKKEKRLTANEPPEWCKDWVYIESTCEFANTRLNYAIKREAFNAKFDRMEDCLASEASAAHMALNVYQIDTVVDKMFWPGAGTIFEHDGKPMLNAYHINGVEPCDVIDEDGQAVVDMFVDHVRFNVAEEREQRILIDWLAYVVQNPGKRVNWALLIQGAQGSGKSYFVKMLQYVLGDHVRNLDPTAIAGRFTGWAHGALVIGVEEIRISGTNRYEVLDRMKPFITNDTVQIEEKGRDHRTVPNFTSYLMLTNHKDAIPLTSGDRRYCVIFSRIQSEEQLYREKGGEKGAEEYFEKLFSETERRADALARFLLDWQLSAEFNPRGRAPDTKARQMMMSVATSPERLALEDAIAKHQCEVINDKILDVTWLNKLCEMEGDDIPKTRTLTAILLEMGYEQIEKKRVKIPSTRANHYVWIRPELCGEMENDPVDVVRSFHTGDCSF